MTHDPNNYLLPLVHVAAATPSAAFGAGVVLLATCRVCWASVTIGPGHDLDVALDRHDAWHDELAHQLAQARA